MTTAFTELEIGRLFRMELADRTTDDNVICLGSDTLRKVYHRGLDCYVALNMDDADQGFVILSKEYPCWPVANKGRWELDEPAIGEVDREL